MKCSTEARFGVKLCCIVDKFVIFTDFFTVVVNGRLQHKFIYISDRPMNRADYWHFFKIINIGQYLRAQGRYLINLINSPVGFAALEIRLRFL